MAAAQGGGSSTIVLPQKLVAQQPATLAVLGPDGRLQAGAVVEFSAGGSVTTDASGRGTFRAPRQPGVLIGRLARAEGVGAGPDASGAVSASATVIAPAENPPDGVQVYDVPRVAVLTEPFAVSGAGFRGEADFNRAMLGEQPALVLAASPVSLVVLPGPGAQPGAAQLVVEVGGRSPGPVPLRLVAFELILDKERLAPGEKAKLRVRARGSEQALQVEVTNLRPETVRLKGGDVQRVRTRGGADNTATVQVEGLRAGDYAVRLRLVRAATGEPDAESIRERLVAARSIAPEAWIPRVERLIELLDQSPQNAPKLRWELEKMLAEKPEGEFGRKLEAAWRAVLK